MCNGSCEKIFPLLNFMSKKMESQKIGIECFASASAAGKLCRKKNRKCQTNLRKCILVLLGPTINPNSGGSRLACETFSFRRNVHHTPFCSAALPLIRMMILSLELRVMTAEWEKMKDTE